MGESANSQVLLSDDFNDGIINSTLWQSIFPFGESSLIESNGYITSLGRGTLGTVAGFNGPIKISGQFRQFNSLDQFKVTIRSDLSAFDSFAERNGITVAFDTVSSFVRLESRYQSTGNYLGGASFNFNGGQTYSFSITDNGSDITVAIDGTSLATGTSPDFVGNHIAFFSREFSFTSAQFDNVRVEALPEPSTYALLLLGGAASLLALKRRRS